jgi:hybrid cluster-associated redox disulfide protein
MKKTPKAAATKLATNKTITKPRKAKPKKAKPFKLTRTTNIGELAAEYPHIAQVLASDYELHCVGCFASAFDTIETGAQIHGMNDEEIDDMIKRLTKIHKQHLLQKAKLK